MNRTTSGDAKGKAERQQTILRLIQEHPISRQEVLLEHLREEGFAVTQATISRDNVVLKSCNFYAFLL